MMSGPASVAAPVGRGSDDTVLVDPSSIRTRGQWHMNSEMELMLKGYGLTTAQILYRLPDHPSLLQTYIWQHYDLAPDFPEMRGFLRFWQDKIEGPIHSVTYVHKKMIAASEWRSLKGEFILH